MEVQKRQFARQVTWPEAGGYVDGITDDRDSSYFRGYVGQSSRLPIRISIEHPSEIRNGSTRTLHYFVLARGQGHRYANFLRLWSTPALIADANQERSTSFQLVQNVLKMLFCRVFGTLPRNVLEDFFGSANTSNIGLNNLPPLFQGTNASSSTRAKYLAYHQDSADPDIVAYVPIRILQKTRERNLKRQSIMLLRADHRRAMEQLLECENLRKESLENLGSPSIVTISIDAIGDELRSLREEASAPFMTPRGQLAAKVGAVISSECPNFVRQGRVVDPLEGVKLTEQNSLVWTSTFEALGSGPSRFISSDERRLQLNKLSRRLIQESGIRVVVLCGLTVQKDVLSGFGTELLGPYELCLRHSPFHLWFLSSARDIAKVIIATPEPLIPRFVKDAALARHLGDVFGLVGTLTCEQLKHNIYENTCFYAAPYQQVRCERDGGPPLTTASIPTVIRNRLHYRGFVQDSDIQELEDSAGCLTLGIQQIMSILAHRSQGHLGAAGEGYQGYRGKFPERFQKTRELFEKLYKRRLAFVGILQRVLDCNKDNGKAPKKGQDLENDIAQFCEGTDIDHVFSGLHDDEADAAMSLCGPFPDPNLEN